MIFLYGPRRNDWNSRFTSFNYTIETFGFEIKQRVRRYEMTGLNSQRLLPDVSQNYPF